jgi:predicted enzyme related to lactoylglutathione lyase
LAIKFGHTNIIAKDWRALAGFYARVFGCRLLAPERDHRGEWIEKVTGIAGVRIRGAHLALPGFGDHGPTLEIFTYDENLPAQEPALNRPGFAHIAFAVDDVEGMLAKVIAEGGSRLGEVATHAMPEAGRITLVYARDPEGNILELQSWS